MKCHACGVPLSEGARYCHKCGADVVGPRGGWRVGLPWGVAGLAVGALLAVAVTRASNSGSTPPTATAPFAGNLGGRPPDISRMSPEERAKRLFDRVVDLAQRGVQDSVQFFMPMALGAYAQLPTLSLDAHFDLGVLQLAGGNPVAGLAEADTILATAPTHLFGLILQAQGRGQQGDSVGARRAYAAYLTHERAERARQLPEYTERSAMLDAFHTEATAAARGSR
jgi:hypothetical protein